MAILDISTSLKPDFRERALARIGYFVDTKKRGRQVDYRRLLAWFVAFPSQSPDSHSLREEVRALQEVGFGGSSLVTDDAGVVAHLQNTQRKVAQYLDQLIQTGRIEFGEFTISPSIFVPHFRGISNFPYSLVSSEPVEASNGKGLCYLFYLVLKGAGDCLRHCSHCGTLFVQARRKQRFCTPRHQQVASMRDLRARQQKAKEAEVTQKPSQQRKGTRTHGAKTR